MPPKFAPLGLKLQVADDDEEEGPSSSAPPGRGDARIGMVCTHSLQRDEMPASRRCCTRIGA